MWSRLLTSWLLLAGLTAFGQQLRVQANTEKQQVYVGEPFVFQIQVEGSESPERPSLGSLDGFNVEELGGQQNSSTSVTVVNGRMSREVRRGYIFNYRLTATREGVLTIPPVIVKADGQTARTLPVTVRATPPQETENIKLRLSLSRQKAYVGQPVILTVKWYVASEVRNYSFQLPVLDDKRFTITSPKVKADPNRHVQLQLASGQVVAEKARTTLDGREYLSVTFRKVLIPNQAGNIAITKATVAGEALRGYQRNRGMMDDFFGDMMPFGRRAVFENFVVPSNSLALNVLELPAAGRPGNFSGLVGNYRLSVEATPTEVNVGDPITLKLRVSGPEYLDAVELPPLGNQTLLERNFKIPPERAAGVVEGAAKNFTQTIRAKHSDVAEIPPIELSYFNPDSGSYEVARTTAVPLVVHGTRVVTARDAEGFTDAGTVQSEIESAEGGIAYNYEGPDVLLNQAFGASAWLRSPAWIGGLTLPPLLYLAMWSFIAYSRWRDADPAARKAKRAFRELEKSLRILPPTDTDEHYAAVLDALRQYLGARLHLSAGALTFTDARKVLEKRGVARDLVDSVGEVFQRSEAGRYAGAAFSSSETPLAEATRSVARKLEAAL